MLPSVVRCSNNINTALVLAITPIMIQYCECTHPAIALIRQGAFTSTPVNPPKWAFDLQYLAFVSEQFLAGIPNYSAWCNSAVAFLTKDGCQQVPTAVSKAKFQASICITHSLSSQLLLDLSSSLQHYQLVLDRISTLIERVIFSNHSTASSTPVDRMKEPKDGNHRFWGGYLPLTSRAPFHLHPSPTPLFLHWHLLTSGSKHEA